MQINTLKTFLLGLLLATSFLSYATETDPENDKPFDTKELIFHHIKDSHSFHVTGDLSLPLPVILWTKNGLTTFMSSDFHHDVDG